MKLNKKQKYYLLDNEYFSGSAVNLLEEWGWKKYLVDNFSWELTEERDQYGLNRLTFTSDSEIKHIVGIKLADDELKKIKEIKSK